MKQTILVIFQDQRENWRTNRLSFLHKKCYVIILSCCNCRFLDPLMFGDYPSSMRERVGSRLPTFSRSEASLLKGSLDFVGINHYTTFYARHNKSNVIGTLLNDSVSDSGAITLRKLPVNLLKLF